LTWPFLFFKQHVVSPVPRITHSQPSLDTIYLNRSSKPVPRRSLFPPDWTAENPVHLGCYRAGYDAWLS